MLKKVVITGPESTGKSTLTEQLAMHYHTAWCPEYAREYLIQHGVKYSYDDLLAIAIGQIAIEENFIEIMNERQESQPAILFIDTDLYVIKIWSEFVFGKCHPFILDQIANRKYDCYLLCDVDLPWTYDALREYPDLKTRQDLFKIYKGELANQSLPVFEINGDYEQRLNTAIRSVDSLMAREGFQ